MMPRLRFTHSTDISLRYLEWEGDGSPVIVLHGLTVSAEYWSLTAQLLSHGHRVFAVDLRGHGHSDKPDWGYDYPTVANDVAQLCMEVDVEGALLAGHSWGSGVALYLAASRPELVSCLAMVDGGFGGSRRAIEGSPPDYSQRLAPLEIYRSKETYLDAAGAGLRKVMTPEIEDILMSSVTVNQDGSISERLSRDNQVRILQSMGSLNTPELYKSLEMPVLFAAALSSDPEREERNERRRKAVWEARGIVRRSRESWFPDTAHDIQLHRPQELAQALEEFIGWAG